MILNLMLLEPYSKADGLVAPEVKSYPCYVYPKRVNLAVTNAYVYAITKRTLVTMAIVNYLVFSYILVYASPGFILRST